MGRVAIKWNAQVAQVFERSVLPMITVRVGEDDGADFFPRGAGAGKPRCQLPRTEPGVDQQAESVRFEQGRIAGTAARENGKAKRHHTSRLGSLAAPDEEYGRCADLSVSAACPRR